MTKTEALKQARQLRGQGKQVKVMCRSGVYTQPGRGVVAFVEYFLQIV